MQNTIKCKECEVDFIKYRKMIFCSESCAIIFQRRTARLKKLNSRKGISGIDKLENETWKILLDGHYLISNKSRFFSIARDRLLKPSLHHTGYYQVSVSKLKKGNSPVHRLIAENYIPNPNNYPIINHINGIKTDNRIENLEWCTYSYNQNHAYKNNLKPGQKEIQKFDLDGVLLDTYKSLSEACRINNFKNNVTVSRCCLGKYETAYGFKWKYTEQSDKKD